MRITAILSKPDEHTGPRAELLQDLGHEVEIVCFEPDPALNIRQHAPSENQPVPWPISKSQSFARLVRFYRLLQQVSGEVWHVQFARGFHAFLASVARRAPLVVSTMGGDIMFDERPENTFLVRFLVRRLLRSADAVTGKSQHSLQQIRRIGVRPERVHLVAWGINPEHYKRVDASVLRRELEISSTATVLFSVRVLRPLYNIHVIVEAFARLSGDSNDCILLVTRHGAEPEYEQKVRDLVTHLGLGDRIRFVDRIEPERMVEYYALSDIVIGIPNSDGLPQSMLEAMACERIVIVPDDPRYRPFVVDGETGFLTDRTVESLHETLQRALAELNQWPKIGAAARERVASSANSADEGRKFEAVLQSSVETARSRGRFESIMMRVVRFLILGATILLGVYPFFMIRITRLLAGHSEREARKIF